MRSAGVAVDAPPGAKFVKLGDMTSASQVWCFSAPVLWFRHRVAPIQLIPQIEPKSRNPLKMKPFAPFHRFRHYPCC
jgi:hypothetical protein